VCHVHSAGQLEISVALRVDKELKRGFVYRILQIVGEEVEPGVWAHSRILSRAQSISPMIASYDHESLWTRNTPAQNRSSNCCFLARYSSSVISPCACNRFRTWSRSSMDKGGATIVGGGMAN